MIVFDEDFVLLDLEEVAGALKVSMNRVRAFIQADTLATVYHGGRPMVAADEVERFRRVSQPAPTRSATQLARRFRPPSRPGRKSKTG